ncbi:hypothetical protein [Maribacter cobaltidurans]|uniref:Uncharacterized protein n=3 Tax=Flavobacteriaceae TaxID=49546 RepID=A0A223V8K8_9FLAO|nr:hypothetical protein [Maribacter cobaltidurans]ASV31587.1 hypothetical protein CJ263_15955 [Maribacter cobaltidurans]MCL6219297.1 hypothetical protein [Zunongwangia pacifica]GGD96047.1 hypothetical protein GCM10011412_37720 [Maribacter cobaltidurans]
MSEMNHPILEKNKIIKATIISLLIGAALLVIAVLPAEYGIDPTGAGKLIGFSKLYVPEDPQANNLAAIASNTSAQTIKLEKAGSGPNVERPLEADNPPPTTQLNLREDETKVIVPAGKGIEFKLNMLKYGKMKYEWTTSNNEILYFDFHGEVKQEGEVKEVYFESYTIANSNNMVGTFYAPYEGKHGWFFRNNSNEDVTVYFRLKGQYTL